MNMGGRGAGARVREPGRLAGPAEAVSDRLRPVI